jgi:NAD(P)-dependent dehydrogenase (short-subunit alcohol dehydrogenase family)
VLGKVLIITGAAGIGAAAVRQAAAQGARLVIATADEIAGWELAAETGAECWTGDLHRPAAADSVIAQALSKFGRVDAVFNVAGASGRRYGDGPIHEIADDAWQTTIDSNLTVTFRMCRAAAGRMIVQEADEDGIRGAIVNVTSVLVESPESKHFATHAYAAAKGAIAAMSRSMAAYYAPLGVRVNGIAPGLAGTPAGERTQADPKMQEFLNNKQPLTSGTIDAAKVAAAALFLLSRSASAITGEIITIDAGWRFSGS